MNGWSLTKFVSAAALAVGLAAGPALAQDDDKLSEGVVEKMTIFALATIPSETEKPSDGTVIKFDKAKPETIIVPLEDRRRVLKVAERTANTIICDMPVLQEQNYLTMMRKERAKNKWSDQQLYFIRNLHLFAANYLSGKVDIREKEDGSLKIEIHTDLEKSDANCTDEQKQRIRAEIESYVKSASKS